MLNEIQSSRIGDVNKDVPYVGMKFNSEDNADLFYKSYAHKTGFSVRKQFVNSKRTTIRKIKKKLKKGEHFVVQSKVNKVVAKRSEYILFEHAITRVDCLAQITCN